MPYTEMGWINQADEIDPSDLAPCAKCGHGSSADHPDDHEYVAPRMDVDPSLVCGHCQHQKAFHLWHAAELLTANLPTERCAFTDCHCRVTKWSAYWHHGLRSASTTSTHVQAVRKWANEMRAALEQRSREADVEESRQYHHGGIAVLADLAYLLDDLENRRGRPEGHPKP